MWRKYEVFILRVCVVILFLLCLFMMYIFRNDNHSGLSTENVTIQIYDSSTFMYDVYTGTLYVDQGLKGGMSYDTDHCAVLKNLELIGHISESEIREYEENLDD